jgi:hypothetical protein
MACTLHPISHYCSHVGPLIGQQLRRLSDLSRGRVDHKIGGATLNLQIEVGKVVEGRVVKHSSATGRLIKDHRDLLTPAGD